MLWSRWSNMAQSRQMHITQDHALFTVKPHFIACIHLIFERNLGHRSAWIFQFLWQRGRWELSIFYGPQRNLHTGRSCNPNNKTLMIFFRRSFHSVAQNFVLLVHCKPWQCSPCACKIGWMEGCLCCCLGIQWFDDNSGNSRSFHLAVVAVFPDTICRRCEDISVFSAR